MSLSATNPQGIIAHLSRRSDAAGLAARKAMLRFVQRDAAGRIRTEAKQKAPFLWGDLEKSARDYDTPDGARIVFGGLAARYAGVVHRRAHEPQVMHGGTKRSYWHVYRGSGLPGHPGELNPPRRSGHRLVAGKGKGGTWLNAMGKPIRPKDKVGWWRYQHVHYAKRDAAANHPKTGHSHFLFGKANSAYEEQRTWMLAKMAAVGVRAAGQAVRGKRQ